VRVRRAETFIDDVSEAYSYLSEQSPRAADRLLDRIELLTELLDHFPEIGRRRPRLGPSIRSHPIRGFRYVAFYRSEGGEVVLLRLWHGARRLGRKAIGG
jgi:plasmid stabilization system protein ParE